MIVLVGNNTPRSQLGHGTCRHTNSGKKYQTDMGTASGTSLQIDLTDVPQQQAKRISMFHHLCNTGAIKIETRSRPHCGFTQRKKHVCEKSHTQQPIHHKNNKRNACCFARKTVQQSRLAAEGGGQLQQ